MQDHNPKKKITIGSWLSMGNPFVAEIMAKSGFEWLVIDMEHSAANSLETVQQLIQVIDLAGCRPFVRVPSCDSNIIKIVLDAGAQGIIVPMINSVDEATAAVEATYYSPLGKRGVGLWRAQGYGRGFEDYMELFSQKVFLAVQIEHVEGVANLEEILEVEGVDGILVGPYDLSSSLGVPGKFDNPSYVEALDSVRRISGEADKWLGIHIVHPSHEELKLRIDEGYNFIAYGVDFTYLTTVLDQEMSQIKDLKLF